VGFRLQAAVVSWSVLELVTVAAAVRSDRFRVRSRRKQPTRVPGNYSGSRPAEANALSKIGKDPLRLIQDWWASGIPFEQVGDWLGAGLTPEEAVAQRASGISVEQAAHLRALRHNGFWPTINSRRR
jgi:hypothetical protein